MIDSTDCVRPIVDLLEIDKLHSLLAGAVDENAHIDTGWVHKRRWVLVPVESPGGFSPRQSKLLSRTMLDRGVHSCVAILAEARRALPPCYRVQTSHKCLMQFSYQCGSFCHALFPENLAFLILTTCDDYAVIAGEQSFVEAACGRKLHTARRSFRRFADDASGGALLREFLQGIADRYGA